MLDEEGLRALQERVQNPPSLDEALPASKELVEALTPLAAESPAKYQAQLATAWKFRGVHLGLTEHQAEAEEAFATAADLFRGLATVTDPESLFTFAISLIDLADHRLKQDDDAVRRALEPIEEIRGLGEQLARDDATAAEDLQTHAARLHALALHRLGDHPAAIEQAERAHRGLTRMERRDPEARVLAAENLRTLGMSLSEVNRFKDARKRLEDSRYLFRRLAKREPERFLVERDRGHLPEGGQDDPRRELSRGGRRPLPRRRPAQPRPPRRVPGDGRLPAGALPGRRRRPVGRTPDPQAFVLTHGTRPAPHP